MMPNVTAAQCQNLFDAVKRLYAERPFLLFHGWHHVHFVYKKAAVFAADLGADLYLSQSCALVHDLNYLADQGRYTAPAAGQALRAELLGKCGFDNGQIEAIETTVLSAETAVRDETLSLEAKALSDADTLFKAVPTTPILFASRFIEQNNYDLAKLADKIVAEQQPLMEKGLYFYSAKAKAEYIGWAECHLTLWQGVKQALSDPDITDMLEEAGFNPSIS